MARARLVSGTPATLRPHWLRHALILDNQVAWIVQQLSTMSFLGRRGQSRAWTTYRYAVYLHWMHLVAAKLDVPTDAEDRFPDLTLAA